MVPQPNGELILVQDIKIENMREFNIISKFDDACARSMERLIGNKLEDNFKHFMSLYSGHSIYEQYFKDRNSQEWILAAIDNFTSIFKLTKEFKNSGWGNKIPFGYDEGGWHYCLSFDKETYGKVLVNRWTDHSPKEQFLIIADSFEDFINGLEETKEDLVYRAAIFLSFTDFITPSSTCRICDLSLASILSRSLSLCNIAGSLNRSA